MYFAGLSGGSTFDRETDNFHALDLARVRPAVLGQLSGYFHAFFTCGARGCTTAVDLPSSRRRDGLEGRGENTTTATSDLEGVKNF